MPNDLAKQPVKHPFAEMSEDELRQEATNLQVQIKVFDADIELVSEQRKTANKTIRAIMHRLETIAVEKLANAS